MIEIDWSEQINAERGKLFAYAVKSLKDYDLALDLVQETLMKAFRFQDDFKGGNFGGWLMSILKTLLIDHYRKIARRPLEQLFDFYNYNTATEDAAGSFYNDEILLADDKVDLSAEESYLSTEVSTELLEALEKVTPVFRECLELEFFDSLTPTEISKYLNIPRGTANSRRHKGLKQMKELLSA